MSLSASILEKEEKLKKILSGYDSLAIAYSGGVDSTYLSAVAHEVLGRRAFIVLGNSPSVPKRELKDARDIARRYGWNFSVIATDEFKKKDYLKNGPERCYHCKTELFAKIREHAAKKGIGNFAYGAIEDDKSDYRPGSKAAKEHDVAAPLQDVGLGKEEIRVLSRRRSLSTSEKASFACLSSRFPTGTSISCEYTRRIEKAEDVLFKHRFRQYRVRHHGDLCRIEIEQHEFGKIIDEHVRENIICALKRLGWRHVTLDLAGYRTGSTAGFAGNPNKQIPNYKQAPNHKSQITNKHQTTNPKLQTSTKPQIPKHKQAPNYKQAPNHKSQSTNKHQIINPKLPPFVNGKQYSICNLINKFYL